MKTWNAYALINSAGKLLNNTDAEGDKSLVISPDRADLMEYAEVYKGYKIIEVTISAKTNRKGEGHE